MNQPFKPVNTKRDFVRRFIQGEFGNKGPNWQTVKALEADPVYGTNRLDPNGRLYHLRNRQAGGTTHYNLGLKQILELWKKVQEPTNWYGATMAPHQFNLLQGEVRLSPTGLDLFCSNAKDVPMREALVTGKTVTGLNAIILLRSVMDPTSYDWLQELLERYPGHVIEFSTFSTNWGNLPNLNTVFWEVRNY